VQPGRPAGRAGPLARTAHRIWQAQSGLNWRAAALLGLLSSTFSTAISQLTATRIGRDALVDWTVVANIPMRDPALQLEPTALVIAVGILFHQWADFSWELTFFGLFGRWTAALRPPAILLLALPWAIFTSAAEWFVLVPLLPFRQPIFPLEQPYWIGLLVHLSSASMYPLFPWIRDRLANRSDPSNRRFAAAWGGLAAAGLLGVAVLAALGWQGHEWPWTGRTLASDQAFMRRMATHHAQGIELARIGAAHAADPHLRALARLMAAEQSGENAILAQWWQSWFGPPLPPCSPGEQAEMPGMLTPAEIDALRQQENGNEPPFDTSFVQLMTRHHRGAVAMADAELRGGGDIRLRIMAQAIRHGQQGEIELMRGTAGVAAVRAATLDQVVARLLPEPPSSKLGRSEPATAGR
jgi:uncharacterized protein (DUF305 family)